MCPWNKDCEWSDFDKSTLPNECPPFVANSLRYELLEALSNRDYEVNFMTSYGSLESRIAIGLSDEGWMKKINIIKKEQGNADRILAQMNSSNIGLEKYTRDRVKNYYSDRLNELEAAIGSIKVED